MFIVCNEYKHIYRLISYFEVLIHYTYYNNSIIKYIIIFDFIRWNWLICSIYNLGIYYAHNRSVFSNAYECTLHMHFATGINKSEYLVFVD